MGSFGIFFSSRFVRRNLIGGLGFASALELGEGAVELAVEHVLVAHELEHLLGSREGGGEGAALEAKAMVLSGLREAVLNGGDLLFVELADPLGQIAEEDFAHPRSGKFADVGGIAGLKPVEHRAGVVEGLGIIEVQGLEELKVVGTLVAQVAGVLKLSLKAVDVVLVGTVAALTFIEGFTEGADLEALSASQPPETGGDAFDEGPFDYIPWIELFEEAFEESLELFGSFRAVAGGDDDLGGEEAVPDGVACGAGLAAGGFGTGRLLGVAAVGREPAFGDDFSHGKLLLSGA